MTVDSQMRCQAAEGSPLRGRLSERCQSGPEGRHGLGLGIEGLRPTHGLHSSSFLLFIFRTLVKVLNRNHKKELLWSPWAFRILQGGAKMEVLWSLWVNPKKA